jgi:hypothetical protein
VSAIQELRSYVEQLRRRFRLGAVVRGTAIVAAVALIATVLLTVIISRFAFSRDSLWGARGVLLLSLALAATFGLAVPLWGLGRRWWTRAERTFPQFEQRLLTFGERDRDSRDPFLELLAADTLRVARSTDVKTVAPDTSLIALLAVGVVSLGTLIWLIRAGPGYLGYGAAALWTGPGAAPFYRVRVSPGDATVRRHADQLVTATVPGLQTGLRIHVRYQSASKWEEVIMLPRPAADGSQFLFAGIPEDVEYYVEAAPVQSPHFHLRVADIPTVKQIRVTYQHPDWMHLADTVEEHGGDLRAVAGTEAQLEIVTDRPLSNGVLSLDDGRELALGEGAGGNVYHGSIKVEKDGSYHVAVRDKEQVLRISEDYFIEANAVKPPEVAVVRPERDYRASPIEEVTLQAKADDPFGLSEFALHYSVNGGPEKTVNLMKPSQSGGAATRASGDALLNLESLKLVPGDVVGYYAVARDVRSESHTDIAFIQIEPFEREFSQSQQSGGGGGGGGVADNQAQIAEREKEIIAATWKQAGLKDATSKQAAEQAKFLADVQGTLRAQAFALAGRLEMRDLQLANEQFGSFQQDMVAAATAMQPATQKLSERQWNAAVFDEQKALQYLLRAEATFRQIEVAFGSRGGGSGGVNTAGRDLASLFDLELDTQKNQYESAQTPSSPGQHAADVEDALRKLDELARRQSELAAQRSNDSEQSAEERWQQEMLRRKADELQQQLEQMARGGGQAGAGSNSGPSGRAPGGKANAGSNASANGNANGRGNENGNESGNGNASANANTLQALDRLRQAEDDMRRAVDEHNVADARHAVDQLREATKALGGLQQQDASRQVDALAREAGRLANQQREQAQRLRGILDTRVAQQGGAARQRDRDGGKAVGAFIDDRQKLADDLARLTQEMHTAERAALGRSHDAASKLRGALSDLEQADTETQLQRSADVLRRGYGPITDAGETEIASEMQHLRDQLGEAQQAMSRGQPSSEGALGEVERLRSRLATLDRSLRGGSGESGGQVAGPVTGGARGGDGGFINGGWNAGNNSELPRPVAPDGVAPRARADSATVYEAGVKDLEQLRRSVGDDPEARRQVDDLIRSMERLDPKRFPGNPAMVDELYARVVSGVDKLELQLRHVPDGGEAAEVRSDNPSPMPSGYQGAVADYFRRLSKNP